jgi:hypothetical protein
MLLPVEDFVGGAMLINSERINQIINLFLRERERDLTEGTATPKVLSSRKRKENDRIGESQPFRERTLSTV